MSEGMFDGLANAQRPQRKHEPAKKDAGLADGYCARCDQTVMPEGICYPEGHPEARADGVHEVSEWKCLRCGRREGRWTGAVLTGGASEPLFGAENETKIAECQSRFYPGSQPR